MDTDFMRWIVSALPGITAIVALVYQLMKCVRQMMKEKRWPDLICLVMEYMERAEVMFEKGADRKEWVMAMVKASVDTVKYEVDMDIMSAMIDSMCDMSKVVNYKSKALSLASGEAEG